MLIQKAPPSAGGCSACSGLGDASTPSFTDQLMGALGTVLPLGPNGIPVWVLVIAGLAAAWALMPSASEYRRRR
jgi:hypothetical protein